MTTTLVPTYPVGMNITLSIPDAVVERAREIARSRGVSLNALIRDYLEAVAARGDGDDTADTFRAVWAARSGGSGGQIMTRDDVYADRLSRWPRP
jgi:Family of unknown function (DUF6364)